MKLSIIIILLFCCVDLNAQIKKYKKWEQAAAIARKENKDVLIVLTGKEWCASCKVLESNVLQSTNFQEFADSKFVVFEIDLPKEHIVKENSSISKLHKEFSERYDAKAFPSLVVADYEGKMKMKITDSNWELDSVISLIKFGYLGKPME